MIRQSTPKRGPAKAPKPGHPLTPGQIAVLCHVSVRLVGIWIDKGLLRGYRVPSGESGKGHRRVTETNFRKFVAEYKLPVPGYMPEETAHVVKDPE